MLDAVSQASTARLPREEGVAWADVCGVNAIGTVIFLKAVPAHCLRARGRDWANGLAGTALEMEEMWRL